MPVISEEIFGAQKVSMILGKYGTRLLNSQIKIIFLNIKASLLHYILGFTCLILSTVRSYFSTFIFMFSYMQY
jgi:hypothetical protein